MIQAALGRYGSFPVSYIPRMAPITWDVQGQAWPRPSQGGKSCSRILWFNMDTSLHYAVVENRKNLW